MPSVDDLEKLPLLALVAFAARCARRVQPLYRLPKDYPHKIEYERAVERALQMAETFAAGMANILVVDKVVADHTVMAAVEAEAAKAAAEAAVYAAEAASNAARPSGAAVVTAVTATDENAKAAVDKPFSGYVARAAESDYEKLLALDLGNYPDLGRTVDPSESGPLGPLWPDEAPGWYVNALEADSGPATPVDIYFDVAEFGDEEIAEILGRFSDLYHALSGDVLVIDRTETLDPSRVLTPEGVE
jgi:hypothetical protein